MRLFNYGPGVRAWDNDAITPSCNVNPLEENPQMRIESFDQFSQRHGDDPVDVPAAGRRVWSDGASCESFAGHFNFWEPPPGDCEKLRLQIARQTELVARAHEQFHAYRR